MATKGKGKRKRKRGARSFKLWVDNDGRIYRIQPNSGSPTDGFGVNIFVVPATMVLNGVTVNGFKIQQLNIETDDSGQCCWKKIGGAWQCAPC